MSNHTNPELRQLPVLPLRNTVVFPGVPQSIRAGRPGTVKAIQHALEHSDRVVLALMQRDQEGEPSPENLHELGTVARIEQVEVVPGGLQLVLRGEVRGRAVRLEQREDRLDALVRELPDQRSVEAEDPAFEALVRELRQRALDAAEKAGIPDALARGQFSSEDPGELADVVAGSVEIDRLERQTLLEAVAVEQRLRAVLIVLNKRIAVLEAQRDIHDRVQAELGDRQREIVLREQMKAIQDELGESAQADELEELRQRLQALELPDEARKEVDRMLSRLQRGGEGPDAQMARTWLETVVELPWAHRSEDNLDLAHAESILQADHYGLPDVKDRVLELLAVRKLRAARASEQASDGRPAKGSILLFAGPPGVGKTSIAKSIARSLGREYARISLGGVRDEADIRGHRRTYIGAMAGRIVHALQQTGTRNPVILLDEIDKLSVSMQGDPSAALLEVLDPAQNHKFTDHYLGIPFDLSEVLFIATANVVERIPAPLLDRLEPIEFRGYTAEEKQEIAARYLLPRQLEDAALLDDQLTLSPAALRKVIERYTREAGVRQLERALGKLARKIARRVASDEADHVLVDTPDLASLLGKPRVRPERAFEHVQVGTATGMYYTPMGGDVMFVEARTLPGKGELVLTGQLGDVMRESARAAWSWARGHADDLGLVDESLARLDLHIHVPAGAIPKDGPSAGIALTAALVSAMSGVPVRHDVAMTGEITLSGRVLPVGGIKEKVLGAVRAGIRRIILPRENEPDLEDLPTSVREGLDIQLVDTLDQALAIALDESARRGLRRRLELSADPFLGMPRF